MQVAFGIKEGEYKFGVDNRKFVADKEKHVINPSLLSIKGLSQACADDLYELSQKQKFGSFIELLTAMKKIPSLNAAKIDTLIKIDYFSDFGPSGTLLRVVEMCDQFAGRKEFKKENCKLPQELLDKYTKATENKYKITDSDGLLKELCSMIPKVEVPIQSKINWQCEFFGFCSLVIPEKKNVGYVIDLNTNWSPRITIYQLWDGQTVTYKVQKRAYEKQPFDAGCIIQFNSELRNKSRKDENGNWIKLPEQELWLVNYIANITI